MRDEGTKPARLNCTEVNLFVILWYRGSTVTLIKVTARCRTQTRSLPLGTARGYGSDRKATLLVPDFEWGSEGDQNNTANQVPRLQS